MLRQDILSWDKFPVGELIVKKVIATIAAGLVLFVWGTVSWTMLPWRDAAVEKMPNETIIMQSILDAAPNSGLYYIPGDEADYTKSTPTAFLNIKKNGYEMDFPEMMIRGLVLNIIMALLMVFLLGKTSGLGFGQRVGFVTVSGLLIGIAANGPYWNWFGFPNYYTMIQIVDSVIMWFLAGLVLAKLAPYQE